MKCILFSAVLLREMQQELLGTHSPCPHAMLVSHIFSAPRESEEDVKTGASSDPPLGPANVQIHWIILHSLNDAHTKKLGQMMVLRVLSTTNDSSFEQVCVQWLFSSS